MRVRYKVLLMAGCDIAVILAAGLGSLLLRFDMDFARIPLTQYLLLALVEVPVRLTLNYYFGLYRHLWRYASVRELEAVISAVTCGTLLIAGAIYVLPFDSIPRSFAILSWFLNLFGMGAMRFALRIRQDFIAHRAERDASKGQGKDQTRLLVVGAGNAGNMIVKEIRRFPDRGYLPIGYVDDDPQKQNFKVNGIPVLGSTADIPSLVAAHRIDEVLIAIPSAPGTELRRIIDLCKDVRVKFTTLPHIFDLVDGKVGISQIREVQIEDLLRREEVKVDLAAISGFLTDSVVLVTGAGGSIGSELCRQTASYSPRRLVLLGHGENSIYHIEMELRERFPNIDLEPVIADVQDFTSIQRVFQKYSPDVVFHAAAHKHVPLMEKNASEAVKNNVLGTFNVAFASHEAGVKRFVLISTDKAVNPTSIMGASKRAAEMAIQLIGKQSKTVFVAVRFGNVLGSRGSVIPLFKRQIQKGGPVTVTHPEMKRYFMTIPEAVQLVIQAGAMGQGNEVFVLDMGEPVRIVDMARDLIRLSGLQPDVDIKIEFTGMRPGEKLFEELLTAEEGTTATRHHKIFTARGELPYKGTLEEFLKEIQNLADGTHPDYRDIREFVNNLVNPRSIYAFPDLRKEAESEVAAGRMH